MEWSVSGEVALPSVEALGLDEVYRAYAQDVARWVRRLGGPSVDVEDCVQEVFLVAQSRLAGFRSEARLSTWLYRIAHNVVRHQRRKLKRWVMGSAEDAAGHLPDAVPLPPEEIEREQRRKRLYAVLDQMPEKYRTVFILFELEGSSGAEIAELLGAKTETVWVWLHRARADFAKRLAKVEAEEGIA